MVRIDFVWPLCPPVVVRRDVFAARAERGAMPAPGVAGEGVAQASMAAACDYRAARLFLAQIGIVGDLHPDLNSPVRAKLETAGSANRIVEWKCDSGSSGRDARKS